MYIYLCILNRVVFINDYFTSWDSCRADNLQKNIQEQKHSAEYIKTSPAIPMKLALVMAQIWECCLPPGSHPFSSS